MSVEGIPRFEVCTFLADEGQVSEMSSHLQQFFNLCDPEERRSVDREAFRTLCNRFDISGHDADVIFDDLDKDHDGRISFEDFSRGFSDFLMTAGCTDIDSRSGETEETGSPKSERKDETIKQNVWSALTVEAEKVCRKNSNEGKLRWLVDELQSSEKRHLVPYLESAVEELISNLQRLQEEKTQLEESWKREKQEHERHLKRMEEEMDSQVKEAELKLRLKAQADVEDERKSLQSKMDAEMDNLQVHLDLFEKVHSWLQSHPQENSEKRLDEVKLKLDEAVRENRQLRMSLLDTQTSIALMRSELLQLRTLYEEKCRELNSEREKVLEVLHEQDQLSRQLNLLHDVNRRLQDTNDALRSTYDQPNLHSRRVHESTISKGKTGSVIGDYFDVGYSPVYSFLENEDMDDEDCDDDIRSCKRNTSLRRAISMDIVNFPTQKRNRNTDRRQTRRHLNTSDSGVSTARGSQDRDEGFSSTPDSSLLAREENQLRQEDSHLRIHHPCQSKRPTSLPYAVESDSNHSEESWTSNRPNAEKQGGRTLKSSCSADPLLGTDELPKKRISDIIKQLGFQEANMRSPRISKASDTNLGRESHLLQTDHPQTVDNESEIHESQTKRKVCRQMGSSAVELTSVNIPGIDRSEGKEEMANTLTKPKDGYIQNASCATDESLLTSVDEDIDYAPDGPGEKTFNVIFVGDAGVGKSSFALRISKGVFMRHTNSTLGVDFLMRTLRIDGQNITVQLWDTAGQEKFRSITKSYFRKADGVMLLYDCCCEHSFLNVRHWAADIDVSCFYRMMAQSSPATDTNIVSQKIPLMVVANKIDLRKIYMKSGTRCISTEEGQKLAKECDAMFIEASAKDGSNVLPALANLVRCMSSHKELQLSASTMQLCEEKPKKKGCCKR